MNIFIGTIVLLIAFALFGYSVAEGIKDFRDRDWSMLVMPVLMSLMGLLLGTLGVGIIARW